MRVDKYVKKPADGKHGPLYRVQEADGNNLIIWEVRKFSHERVLQAVPASELIEVCPSFVSDGRMGGHTCGKPVKEDGLCGVHAAGKRRKEANYRAKADKRAVERAKIEAAQAELERLGVNGVVNVGHDSAFIQVYRGSISVTLEELRRLVGK